MATTRPLTDEQDNQLNQCRALGADLYIDERDEDGDDTELGFGADPFDILAFKQEQGDH